MLEEAGKTCFFSWIQQDSRPLSNQRTEGILKRSFTGGDQKTSKSFPISHNPIVSATAFLCNSGHHCPVPCSVHSARGPCGRAYGTGPQLRAWPLPLLAPLPMWHARLVWQVMHAHGVEVVEVVVVLEADKRKWACVSAITEWHLCGGVNRKSDHDTGSNYQSSCWQGSKALQPVKSQRLKLLWSRVRSRLICLVKNHIEANYWCGTTLLMICGKCAPSSLL